MKLEDLQGRMQLSAVDLGSIRVPDNYDDDGKTFHDCDACYFRLNGTLYAAIENQNDGYRSSMRELHVDRKTRVTNEFPPIDVFCVYDDGSWGYHSNDILRIYDLETAKVILTVGTRSDDDYYPSFISQFDPTAMSVNQ